MVTERKKCPICKHEEWINLDHTRNYSYWFDAELRYKEPIGFKLCKECGYLTYDITDADTMKRYYTQRRGRVTPDMIVRQNRNARAVFKFLDNDIGGENVLDIGCGSGELLGYFSQPWPVKHGIEWLPNLKAWAEKEHHITIVEKFTRTYDRILFNHSLEHFEDPTAILEDARIALAEFGEILVVIPMYLNQLQEAGYGLTQNFERLFQPDHYSNFNGQTIINLFNVTGLEIVKHQVVENNLYALLKVGEKKPYVKQDTATLVSIIETQKKAIDLMAEKKYDEAIAAYPNFPDAYIAKTVEYERQKNFPEIMQILDAADKACGYAEKLKLHRARILLQWDEGKPNIKPTMTNNIRLADDILKELLKTIDNEEIQYYLSMINGKYTGDHQKAVEHLENMVDINPSKWAEVVALKQWNYAGGDHV